MRERCCLIGLHELRQEGEEEDRELGVEEIDRDRVPDDLRRGARGGLAVDLQRAAFRRASSMPCRAGRRRPRYFSVWNASALVCRRAARPKIAASMCGTMPSVQPKAATALARPPRDGAGRQGEQHTCAGRDHHDQRGQQEFDGHCVSPIHVARQTALGLLAAAAGTRVIAPNMTPWVDYQAQWDREESRSLARSSRGWRFPPSKRSRVSATSAIYPRYSPSK